MNKMTKNQHYVPQFLLRNFSTRHRRSDRIHVFDTIRYVLRCNQNISEVCSQNYFYDDDNWVEKFLEANVETPAAAEIHAMCSQDREVPDFPSRAIARFITVQFARTAEAANRTLAAANGLIGTMSQELLRLNDFGEAAAPRVQLVLTDPKTHHARMALSGCISWILIKDLRQHLIINDSSRDFLISDHPVVQSNLYLSSHPTPHAASMSTTGAQLFLPLSTHHMLCLYDASIYKYGDRDSNVSRIDDEKTVRAINLLQIRNKPSMLLFRDQADCEAVSRMSKAWTNRPLWKQQSYHSPAMPIGNGQLRSVHMVARMQTPPYIQFPFFKIKNSARRRRTILEDRSPQAVEEFNRWIAGAKYRKPQD